jgi:hypothetical protein
MDLRAIEVSFAALCALWWAVTLFAQIAPRRALSLRRYDVFGLVPTFRLFAPRPRFRDHALEFRFSADAPWSALDLRGARGSRGFFWNPHAPLSAIAANAIEALLRAHATRGDAVMYTPTFERVAALVRLQLHTESPLQFRILTRNAGEPGCEPVASFQSPWLTPKP